MMSWGPGNGSRRKKPVAPAAIARISHTVAAKAAAPGRRRAGSVEAVIGTPSRYWMYIQLLAGQTGSPPIGSAAGFCPALGAADHPGRPRPHPGARPTLH